MKKENNIVHSANVLDDYRNWRGKNITCAVTPKFYDQVNYVAKYNKMDISSFTLKALEHYLEHEYPLAYQNAKAMTKIEERNKIK